MNIPSPESLPASLLPSATTADPPTVERPPRIKQTRTFRLRIESREFSCDGNGTPRASFNEIMMLIDFSFCI